MTVESSVPGLRPLRMGELLDRIIRLYRQNFLTFIGIVALVQIPIVLLQLVLTVFVTGPQVDTFSNPNPNAVPDFNSVMGSIFGVAFIVSIFSFIFVQGLGTAALTQAVANSYLGKKTGIIESYKQIGNSWPKLLVALFLAGLVGILLVVWLIIPCIGWLTGPGALVFFATVVIPLIAPVVVLEKQSPSGAIQRVWSLVRRRFWWVFGFAFLLIIFNFLLISGPTALINFIFQSPSGAPSTVIGDNSFIIQTVVQSAVSLILSLLYLPIQLVGYTILYFDLRVRLEGFDLAVLASETAEDGSFDAVGTIESAPKGDSRFAVTWNELGYFTIISIGVGILYFLLVAIIVMIALASVAATF